MAYGHGGKRPGAGRKPGRMNATTACVREIALTHGSAAIDKAPRLAGLVVDEDGKRIGMATSEQAQIAALGIILDRAYGKPSQATLSKATSANGRTRSSWRSSTASMA